MDEISDEQLMQRIGAGNQAAFAMLVERHLGRTTGMAARLLGSRADGEEVAQEAFTRVWVNAPKWRSDAGERTARFSTWLYRVVVNLCIDRKRRRTTTPLEDVPEPEDDSDNALDLMAREATRKQVAAAIRQLPERQQQVLSLCFFEGLSNAEAGDMMGLSVKAVESLLVRARRGLREVLAPVYQEL